MRTGDGVINYAQAAAIAGGVVSFPVYFYVLVLIFLQAFFNFKDPSWGDALGWILVIAPFLVGPYLILIVALSAGVSLFTYARILKVLAPDQYRSLDKEKK